MTYAELIRSSGRMFTASGFSGIYLAVSARILMLTDSPRAFNAVCVSGPDHLLGTMPNFRADAGVHCLTVSWEAHRKEDNPAHGPVLLDRGVAAVKIQFDNGAVYFIAPSGTDLLQASEGTTIVRAQVKRVA